MLRIIFGKDTKMKLTSLLKSIVILIVVIILCFFCYKKSYAVRKYIVSKSWRFLPNALALIIMIPIIIYLLNYVNPFDRKVNFSLYETITYENSRSVHDGKFYPDWYGVYKWKIYDSGDEVDSRWSLWQFPTQKEYDFSEHSYFVSYGRQIKNISYNVWEQDGCPIIDLGTEPKWSIVQFDSKIDPRKVYIYEIDRMYIDRKPPNEEEWLWYSE